MKGHAVWVCFKNAPLWVEAVVWMKQDGPELITVAVERQTHEWGCHIVLSSFNRLDIFYNNQKEKLFQNPGGCHSLQKGEHG